MYFELKGFTKPIVCKIGKKRIPLKRTRKETLRNDILLSDGKHEINIEKLSFHSSPLYYFNIINPIYYLWNLRLLGNNSIEKENFLKAKIVFEIEDADSATMVIASQYYGTRFECIESKGIKVSKIECFCDNQKFKRYKITYILSSLFYMIVALILSIQSYFLEGGLSETIVLCLLIVVFSLEMIFSKAEKGDK